VGAEHRLVARVRGIDLRVIDWVVAVLLTAAALADAASQPHSDMGALAVVSCIVLTGSVAWRRRDPVLSTLVAVTGLIAFQLASGYAGDGSFEAAAIALNFYLLGSRTHSKKSVRASVAVFAYWLAGAAVVSYNSGGGSVAEVLSSWALLGGLPFAVGRTLATRRVLTRELASTAARLEDEQEVHVRRAAAEERNRMARELHDVIAHNVSVMVIQTSAARRVARTELEAAREALRVVEGAGREALVELRRIVGVLRHTDDQLAGSAAPGLSQLNALADRARAAGLPVDLRLQGRVAALAPGLDLVAYRVVQEALTNAIKHAGPARAQVKVSVGAREIELEVTDNGCRGAPGHGEQERSGHGLVGMSERVMLYGGELHAQRSPRGGFEVRARIPLDGAMSSTLPVPPPREHTSAVLAPADPLRWRWLDPLLAAVLLVAFEIEVLTSSDRRGPLVLNMVIVAAMALAAIWRRRSPLLFLIVVGMLAEVLSGGLDSLRNSTVIGVYTVLVPTYTVAAWEERRRAVLGLGIFLCGAALGSLILSHSTFGYFAGGAFTLSAAWAAGRAIRSRRVLTSELKRRSARLQAERDDRARLAVAGERTRIARELHALVAHSVTGMVVQAEAARALLDRDRAQADTAMDAIEHTGRQALSEMRRILGVLRHNDEVGELQPQPGVDRIYALIQRAREHGQPVELSVAGEPGTLPAGVDLGIYRILEDALRSAAQQPGGIVGVALRFGEVDLELHLTAECDGPSGWPTLVMRERVALCGGEEETLSHDDRGWRFGARLPRGLQGAFA
jgi:signal transduction histidine kinase